MSNLSKGWMNVAKAVEGGSSEVEFMHFKPGEPVTFRVISDEPIQYWKHWVQHLSRSFICPGKGCPICAINDQEKAKGGQPKYNNQLKHHILVLDLGDNQVKILEQSTSFFGELLTLMEEVGDLKTFDIKAIRKGSGTQTSYTLLPTNLGKSLTEEQQKKIDECDLDLSEFFLVPEPQQLVRILNGEPVNDVLYGEGDKSDSNVEPSDIDVDFTSGYEQEGAEEF